jgi:PAS domain-containing protein
MLPSAAVDEILRTVVHVVRQGDRAQLLALDIFSAALYATDACGVVTYFNPACVGFAGRQPTVGQDRWCVTWKLYTDEGDFLPHDQCPMAVAIRTSAAVRGTAAIAERPNGTRVNFMPFPTPVLGEDGKLLGAVNMLVDISDNRKSALRDFNDDLQAWRSLLIEQVLATFTLEEIRNLKGEIEGKLSDQIRRILH